ncbi:hypothetical protein VTJ49DRAFT_3899 [Mycothermus thermophilus]|uniref:CUE domain-containing protein n=1 Tax=Humicola insolens TaxID=85995 RepID=A0ABR3VMP3_HUMIN
MAETTDSVPLNFGSLFLILVVSGVVIRYLFFSPSSSSSSSTSGSARSAARAAEQLRAREAAAERITQMFPQIDRRTALWDLQRTGGNVALTTERILAGRIETVRLLLSSVHSAHFGLPMRPPITFQPPPPPGSNNANANPITTPQSKPAAPTPAYPDLITRYNLHDKLKAQTEGDDAAASSTGSDANGSSKAKGWSQNRDERQSLLQRRRDQMILEARRKMEAKIAAEKAAAGKAPAA